MAASRVTGIKPIRALQKRIPVPSPTGVTRRAQRYIDLEDKYGAHNYHPIPVVLDRAQGVHVWDVDGNRYLDFLSAYSAVNQGHCHPKLVRVMTEQAQKMTLTSRAFYNSSLGDFCKFTTSFFGYDRVLPMNSGAEAFETGIKLARRWAYDVKGIPANQANIIVAKENFHGRTFGAISASTDSSSYGGYGPLLPNMIKVDFDDLGSIETVLKSTPNVAAVVLEPIQGEAGIIIPSDGYLKGVSALCKQYNVLLVCDEVQTGLARTGKMLAVDYDKVKPDILLLGKALSGGMMPISCVLADDEVMLTIKPGQHGSTFGGNPLACKVGIAALEILRDEKLAENAFKMGELFRTRLEKIDSKLISTVRGRGLLNAIVVNPDGEKNAWNLCLKMRDFGLLAKPTHDHIIRLAPPLVINEEQIEEACDIIRESVASLEDSAFEGVAQNQ